MQYIKAMRHYILEIVLIIIMIVLSYVAIEYNEKVAFWGNESIDLTNYFWMPSSIMQTIAAMFALLIAVFVLIMQKNPSVVVFSGDILKPQFKKATYAVAFTIYFNGVVLFIFNHYKPTITAVALLSGFSLCLLVVSLIEIVITSIRVMSTCGLNTHSETMYLLSQGKNIEVCYQALDLHESLLDIKTKENQDKEIEIISKLLEVGSANMKINLTGYFINYLAKTNDIRPINQIINNLDDSNRDVRRSSIWALGIIGNKNFIGPLEKRLIVENDQATKSDLSAAIEQIKNKIE